MFTMYKNQEKTAKKLLTATSIFVLMTSTAAFAGPERTSNQNDVPHYNKQQVEQGLDQAKKTASEVAKDISGTTKEVYEDIRSALNGKKSDVETSVTIEHRTTAAGMIGQPVYNAKAQRVAMVKDIIVNRDGEATMVVLADGGWIGLGKLAAFDYKIMTQTNAQGDIIAPLTEDMMDNAAAFSYDRDASDGKVRVIPKNGYSVAALLDSHIVDPAYQTMADVDNISFQNAKADHLIISFGKTLGLGGMQVAMGFDDPTLVVHDGKPVFQLNADKAKQFSAYKDSALSH